MRLNFNLIFFLVFGFVVNGHAQKGITTFGLNYKPIIPNRIIGTYDVPFNDGSFRSSMQQRLGNSLGMIIRQGLTKNISLETGISFTQRNFNLNFSVDDTVSYSNNGKVRFVAYEIPVKCLVFIRLGKQLYMNNSIGASFNYFPSDVSVDFPIKSNEYFSLEGARLNRVQGAMLADIGFEYRTKRNGYFYFGGAFNLPFTSIVTFAMAYEYTPHEIVVRENVRGSYLTVDLRYYFNEKPRVEQKRK